LTNSLDPAQAGRRAGPQGRGETAEYRFKTGFQRGY
jgi:hypothetical protein